MTKALAKTQGGGALVQSSFTADQVDLIKRTVAKDATDDELQLFLYTAQKRRLDPLAKQLYFTKHRNKNGGYDITFITSIDAYRLTADRTGKYAGNDDPVFDDEDSPRKATVTVYKIVDGVRCPFSATARWDQYYPGDSKGFMWRKMPHVMLGKCAEALALRKAFPEELGGVYVKEEMDQAHVEVVDAEPAKRPVKAQPSVYEGTEAQQKIVKSILKKKKVPEDFWALVDEKLMGKLSTELDQVIAEVLAENARYEDPDA